LAGAASGYAILHGLARRTDHEAGLVLNKTNATAIAEDYGDDTEAWVGRGVELFVQKVAFQGKLMPAIRVRTQATPQPVVQHAPAPPAPEPDAAPLNDDIPWS